MTSFVYIELDTRPPEIKIFAPSYTTTEIVNTIRIESNEALSDYQEIYALDNNGTRHDYTFMKEKANLLIGRVSFFGFPLGATTIYVRLKDEVENTSELMSKTILIRESLTLLKLDIKDDIREISSSDKSFNHSIGNSIRKITINEKSFNHSIGNSIRKITIKDYDREV